MIITDEKLSLLSEKERSVWDMVKSQSGVCYLEGRPGGAKSAICKSMGEKLGLNVVILDFSGIDETDLGIPRVVTKTFGGIERECLTTAIPEWVWAAREEPTLLVLEEINRCPRGVRNVLLGVLNERRVHGVDLGPLCWMVSSGNADGDDVDVEVLDSAFKSRLIPMKWDINFSEWMDWARDKIHPSISWFLSHNEHYLWGNYHEYHQYPSPRSWTILSNFMLSDMAPTATRQEIANRISEVGERFIGPEMTIRFVDALQNTSIPMLLDILSGNDKDVWDKMTFTAKSEILYAFSERGCRTDEEINNITEFLDYCSDDNVALLATLSYKFKDCRAKIFSSDRAKAIYKSVFTKILKDLPETVDTILKRNDWHA